MESEAKKVKRNSAGNETWMQDAWGWEETADGGDFGPVPFKRQWEVNLSP
jgi:hypothetical protein